MRTYRFRCGNCTTLNEVTSSSGRHQKYCSPRCKQAAYRARKRNRALLRYAVPPDASFAQYKHDDVLNSALTCIWARHGEQAAQMAAEFGVQVARKVRGSDYSNPWDARTGQPPNKSRE